MTMENLKKPEVRTFLFVLVVVGYGLVLTALVGHAHDAKVAPGDHYWGSFGVLAVLALWFISGTLTGDWNPLALAMGADNRLSTSKFQVLLWTAAVGFVYAMVYADRLLTQNDPKPITDIPQNVLIALGIAVTSAVAAQAITGSQAATPDAKSSNPTPSYDAAALVRNDDASTASLTKVQLLFWTVVAIVVYLITSFSKLAAIIACPDAGKSVDATHLCSFPDIDTTLMIFMGLGHATYLGGKLVPNGPSLTGASAVANAAVVPTGRVITLTGANLGTSGTITMDGTLITPTGLNWQLSSIAFNLPAKPSGAAWANGTTATFLVSVNGASSGPYVYTYP